MNAQYKMLSLVFFSQLEEVRQEGSNRAGDLQKEATKASEKIEVSRPSAQYKG
jgi:hypothetical protein